MSIKSSAGHLRTGGLETLQCSNNMLVAAELRERCVSVSLLGLKCEKLQSNDSMF